VLNVTNISSSVIDSLLAKVKTETDELKRIMLYQQIEQKVLDEYIVLPLYYTRQNYYLRKNVAGFKVDLFGGERIDYSKVYLKDH